MDKIFIFSGTTEGRELSEYLSLVEINHVVFVATEYGRIVMKNSPYTSIVEGRLDEDDLVKLFSKEEPDYVFDATHPYAQVVSENIKRALGSLGMDDVYVRISRDITSATETTSYVGLKVVNSVSASIAYLKETSGNILLTTGVKTLNEYMKVSELKDRIISRILPSVESLNIALDTKIAPKRIIAMEGPFSTSLNEALIKEYDIKVMVTKNSGRAGGFDEKLKACQNMGIELVSIELSDKEEGISLSKAKEMFAPKARKKLTIAGVGPGNRENMTLEVYEAIKNADLLIGAGRMIKLAKEINPNAGTEITYDAEAIKNVVMSTNSLRNVYIVSGDTGFYSGASGVVKALSNEVMVDILPGISSISYLAAKTHIPYSSMQLLSFHGKEIDELQLMKKESFYALTSGAQSVNTLVSRVFEIDSNARIYIGFNLGYADERIEEFSLDNYSECLAEGLYVVGVVYGGKNE